MINLEIHYVIEIKKNTVIFSKTFPNILTVLLYGMWSVELYVLRKEGCCLKL